MKGCLNKKKSQTAVETQRQCLKFSVCLAHSCSSFVVIHFFPFLYFTTMGFMDCSHITKFCMSATTPPKLWPVPTSYQQFQGVK